MQITKLILIFLLTTAGFSPAAHAVTRTDKNPQFFIPTHGSHAPDSPQSKTPKKHLSGTMEHVTGNKPDSSFVNYFSKENNDSAFKNKIKFEPAPINQIMANQKFNSLDKWLFGGNKMIKEYKKSIVHSYSMTVKDLDLLLQNEYETINQETHRMREIQKHFSTMPKTYRYVNFQLPKQISEDMIGVRHEFAERKQQYTQFMENTPKHKKVFVIIAKNPLFMALNKPVKMITGYFGPYEGVTFVSLFNRKYEHIFTYMRKHSNMLENKGINAAQTTNGRVNQIYQNLFDDYIYDLRRIGAGLDVINSVLLRQVGEMTDDYVTM